MKSKIFLCLLLIVVMFAFAACGGNDDDSGTGVLNNGVDDISDDMDRMTDDLKRDITDGIDGTNDYGNATSHKSSSIKNDGSDDRGNVSGGAIAGNI